MNKKTILLLAVLFLGGAGAFIGYRMWNQPHRNIEDEAADYDLTVTALSDEFRKDAGAAQKKYHDKVVSLQGTVAEILAGDSLTSVALKGNDFCGVLCEMLPGTQDQVSKLKTGDAVKIKAFYMGFIEGDADFGMPGDVTFKKGVILQ